MSNEKDDEIEMSEAISKKNAGCENCDCDCDCDCDCHIQESGLIDRVLGKIISRKFTVFLTATSLMIWSNLDAETWGMIAIVYIGGQSVIDAAIAVKHGIGRK